MRKIVFCFIISAILCCTVLAQQPAASSDQATTADVLQMFKEMHFEQQMSAVQASVNQQMQGMFHNILKGEQSERLPEEKRVKLQEMLSQTMKDAVNVYPVSELINDFAPMYAKYLTKSDVQTITAFYHSPTGQKLLDNAPSITKEAMAVIGPKLQKRMAEYMEKTQKEVAAMMTDSAPAQPPTKN